MSTWDDLLSYLGTFIFKIFLGTRKDFLDSQIHFFLCVFRETEKEESLYINKSQIILDLFTFRVKNITIILIFRYTILHIVHILFLWWYFDLYSPFWSVHHIINQTLNSLLFLYISRRYVFVLLFFFFLLFLYYFIYLPLLLRTRRGFVSLYWLL